jgi:phosphohistidine phosphatase
MKLYLVRHGIAVDRLSGEITSDFKRPLTSEGKEEVADVATGLKFIGVKPNYLVTSPLVRAKQTAEIFAKVFNYKEQIVFSEALAPGGLVSDLYKVIDDLKNANEVCLFGHQPDMTRLAQSLLWGGPDLDIPFKKSGVCRIDIYDLPPTSPGTLKWFITPRIASAIGGK